MPPKVRKERKRAPKDGYNIDPFDRDPRPATRTMLVMTKWHHKAQPHQLPNFLNEFRFVHFLGNGGDDDVATMEFSRMVHELYHSHLESHSDRKSMLACLSMCETIAVLEKENPRTVSAITFLQ